MWVFRCAPTSVQSSSYITSRAALAVDLPWFDSSAAYTEPSLWPSLVASAWRHAAFLEGVCRESKLFLLVHRSNCGLGVSLATVDVVAAPAVQECTGCISDQHGKIFTNDRTKVTVRRSPAKAERRDVQGTCLCVSIPAAIVPFPFYTRTEHSPEQASTCIRRQPQSRDACMWQGELERQ